MSTVNDAWTRVWTDMAMEIAKSRVKDDKEFFAKMRRSEFNPAFLSLKQELLKLYLEKVRYVYALAFY